jgi:serine/threonine-protein kinase
MYEMVTGHRMFSATSSYSVMEAHVKETPRAPIEVQPSIPKGLSDIIMMAVAKDPAQRFQTAEAFRNALSQVGASAVAAAAAMPSPQSAVVVGSATAASTPVRTSPPPTPVQTPTPMPAAYTPGPQSARSGRHVGWIVVAAIVILVALFGGTQVYRSRRQNAAVESATPSAVTTSTPASTPSTAATPPATSPPTTVTDSGTAAAPTPTPPAPHRAAPAPEQPPAAEPVNNGPTPEEIAAQKKLMDDMEKEVDQLDSRAAAAESSVEALEQQMHQSGLGLRGDVVEARSNLRTDMAKAKQALDNMDTDRARQFLDRANHELDKLEAFTGRR